MVKNRFFVACMLVFSCAQTPEQSGEVPEEPIEGRWSCFNGREIVLQNDRYGLVKENGETVLASVYDSIEFLDNDIALLGKDGLFYLCDRNGRMLSGAVCQDSLRLGWNQIVARVLEDDRLSWEKVLRDYDELCHACKAVRGRRLSRKEYARVEGLQEQVFRSLREATGAPTVSQKARLESLSIDYRKAF